MKIYVLVENPYGANQNPYVRTLMDGISSLYNDVEWGYGLSGFWEDSIINYDIIHIHWPDVFLWYNDKHLTNSDVFEKRIKFFKSKGGKIISTCHNLEPHYSNSSISKELYKIVYENSDCILHLGEYSQELFRKKYFKTDNQLLYHHVYDEIYKEIPSQEESIKALNLDSSKFYVLCFGAFRSDEERNLIINLANDLKNSNIVILAPSFYKVVRRRNVLCVLKSYVYYYYYKCKYRNIVFQNEFVDDSTLKYYYGAASVSLIHRLKILNSGNVPLGFLMKKIIIGPNVGNVGTWLKETGNFTFDINKTNEISQILEYIIANHIDGEHNYKYAIENLLTKKISSQLYQCYKKLQ